MAQKKKDPSLSIPLTTGSDDTGPNPIDLHVGRQLRAKRGLKGLTQEDLAAATGVTFQQIQKYEAGKNRISASRLYQFANILEAPISAFFENIGLTSNDSIAPAFGLSDNGQTPFSMDDTAQGADIPTVHEILTSKESIEVLRTYYAIRDEKLRKDFLKMMKQMAKNFQS